MEDMNCETRKLLAFTPFVLSALVRAGRGSPAQAQPDLTVDTKTLQNNWVVRDENLPADYCSVIEGGVTPGNTGSSASP